jgi:hypothetical protein
MRDVTLVDKSRYLKSLESTDFEEQRFTKDEKDSLTANLPDRFWLSEVTLPQLYTANKTKLIDFYYGCEYPTVEEDYKVLSKRWIQIRLPGVLFRLKSGSSA